MAVIADILFRLPVSNPTSHDQQVGGLISEFDIPTIASLSDVEDIQLFQFSVYAGKAVRQYRKVFIKNNSDETLTNFEVYLVNSDSSDKAVKVAAECGQSQSLTLNGDEVTKNYLTAPKRYVDYVYDEYANSTGGRLVIGTLESGDSIGLWLCFETDSLTTDILGKTVRLGCVCEDESNNSLTSYIDIEYHRLVAQVDVIKWSESQTASGSIDVMYLRKDTSAMRIAASNLIYSAYVDRERQFDFTDSPEATVFVYGADIPVTVDIFVIPSSGYDLEISESTSCSRVSASFYAKKPEYHDVERHLIYSRVAPATAWSFVGLVKAGDDLGGGVGFEKFIKDDFSS